jgi:hypothetical protein
MTPSIVLRDVDTDNWRACAELVARLSPTGI